MHNEKRRRVSDRDEVFRDVDGYGKDEIVPEVEVFRLADDESMNEQPTSLPLLDPHDAPVRSMEDELQQPRFGDDLDDEFPLDEPEDVAARSSGLAAAMAVDESVSHAEAPRKAIAPEQVDASNRASRGPKRKMVLDNELQISPEEMRSQLQDTSSILRKIAEEESSASYPDTTVNPFMGSPSLPFLPSGMASMLCFAPKAKDVDFKRARTSEHEVYLEEEDVPTLPSQLRESQESRYEADATSEVLEGPSVMSANKPSPHAQQRGMLNFADDGIENEQEEMQLQPDEEMEQVEFREMPSFETSHQLPEVDAGESVAVRRGSTIKGDKGSFLPDPV